MADDISYRDVAAVDAERANRRDWDAEADAYQAEHGEFLRDVGFVWSPEGLDEADVHLLGDVRGKRVLEIGCGAGQCARWLRAEGADAVGFDLSYRQLQHSRRLDEESRIHVPTACATATAMPFAAGTFDIACSAFGAFPFIVDLRAALTETMRVLRPGGRLVFSVTHPIRRMLPDDPTAAGLVITRSYFDRRPYVESDASGTATYVEPHHTIGDWVDALTTAGLVLDRVIEPEWPPGHRRSWAGWGPERGTLVPGTLVVVAHRPGPRTEAP